MRKDTQQETHEHLYRLVGRVDRESYRTPSGESQRFIILFCERCGDLAEKGLKTPDLNSVDLVGKVYSSPATQGFPVFIREYDKDAFPLKPRPQHFRPKELRGRKNQGEPMA